MKVSCIIPTYNCEKYIGKLLNQLKCVESKLIEIIVIDDGSIDNTENLVNSLKEDNIKYFKYTNAGVSSARNKGIKHATGDYLCFLDADDEIDVNEFSDVVNTIMSGGYNPDVYMIGYVIKKCNTTNNINQLHSLGNIDKLELNDLKNRLIDVKFAKNYKSRYIGGKVYQYFVKRILFEKGLEFPEGIHFAEDLCYCMNLFDIAQDMVVLDANPYIYNVIQGSASHRYRHNMWNEWISISNYVGRYIDDDVAMNRLLYWAGKVSIREYAKHENPEVFRRKSIIMISDRNFINSFQELAYNDWTVFERIENFLIKKKCITILMVYEYLFLRLKKYFLRS